MEVKFWKENSIHVCCLLKSPVPGLSFLQDFAFTVLGLESLPVLPASQIFSAYLLLPLGSLHKPAVMSWSSLHHIEIVYLFFSHIHTASSIPTQLGLICFLYVIKQLLENFRLHKSRKNSILNRLTLCCPHPHLTTNILPVLFSFHHPILPPPPTWSIESKSQISFPQ